MDQTAEAAQHLEQTRLLLEEPSAALRMRRVAGTSHWSTQDALTLLAARERELPRET